MAEREGFEPPIPFRVCLISSLFFALLQALAKGCKNSHNAIYIRRIRELLFSHKIAEECKKVANQQPPLQPPELPQNRFKNTVV